MTKLFKLREGRPNALDMIKNGDVQLIINTPSGKDPARGRDEDPQHRARARIPIITTMRAAHASVNGIRALQEHGLTVKTLQEYHQ